MKKPTAKQIKAKINSLNKQRFKLSREAITLQHSLQKEAQDAEAKKFLKFKYVKQSTEILYIHSITINKRDIMNSVVKAVRVLGDRISPIELELRILSFYKPVKQDVFVKAYNDAMNKIDGMLPLIKKTKVGL
jgi:hypothetical protein